MNANRIRELFDAVLQSQGRSVAYDDATDLRAMSFRSLDFSELALRVEDEIGAEINFDADKMRSIQSVGDVIRFFDGLTP